MASASPRRRELLARILPSGSYTIDPVDIDERAYEVADPVESACAIARAKAEVAFARHPDAAVITADTVVYVGSIQFGKPIDEAEAVSMLGALSGRSHFVVTAYCVRAAGFSIDRNVVTAVTFRPLSVGEIEAYVATGESMDKAGAYAIQGGASGFVSSVEGSLENVIGLPVFELELDLQCYFAKT